MSQWHLRQVPFRYQLSDWTLFSVTVPLETRVEKLGATTAVEGPPLPPATEPGTGSAGYCIRSLPVSEMQNQFSVSGNYYRYVPLQYPHCYIDLSWSFEQYVGKFSAKTRSTIQRKIRKYAEYCGGALCWKEYSSPEEITEFFRLAREVSKLTYQERLLEVGLPDDKEFVQSATSLATKGSLRAYLLFHGEKPVSYLYCPEKDGILVYAYLGYDPGYQQHSVGTILQWLAIENIFKEKKFLYFDFTEGLSSHKQLFSTHQRLCANVFFVRRSFRNFMVIRSHQAMNLFSKWLGDTLERHGLKAKVRKLLRRT